MNGDLLSLRLLVVSSVEPERALMREGAALASIPIEFVEADGAITAFSTLAAGGIDLAFVDCAIPVADRGAIIKAARSTRQSPFVILLVAPGISDEECREGLAPDGIAEKPNSLDHATRLVDRCSRLRLPTRVLVVDDSSTTRSIVRKILAASRFKLEIAEAAEGYAALHQLDNGNFDFVFLDHNMPGLNGIDTLTQIKRQHPRLQVVIMTSMPDEAVIQRARMAGAAAFLKKPFFPAHIDAVLHSLYGLRPPSFKRA